jgi:hypothetical protein
MNQNESDLQLTAAAGDVFVGLYGLMLGSIWVLVGVHMLRAFVTHCHGQGHNHDDLVRGLSCLCAPSL